MIRWLIRSLFLVLVLAWAPLQAADKVASLKDVVGALEKGYASSPSLL